MDNKESVRSRATAMSPRQDNPTEGTSLVEQQGDVSRSRRFTKLDSRLVKWTMAIIVAAVFLVVVKSPGRWNWHAAPTTGSKYKRVQGIGFQIYTGAAPAFLKTSRHSKELNPECVGRASYGEVAGESHPFLQCYIGHDDPMVDVEKRAGIMKDAVEKAYESADTDDRETLKIFIAPEFYWRGLNGAYLFSEEAPGDPQVCGPVCRILREMEEFVAQERFEDWLFVFGTVVAEEALAKQVPYDYLFYNFAILYKGYDPAKTSHHGKRFLVPKRYVSSSDFLTPWRHLDSSKMKELIGEELPEHDNTVYNPHDFDRRRYDYAVWEEYKDELNDLGYAMIEYDWLMVDGLAVTLEICFDHQMRTALNSYTGDIITGQQTLIPSSSDRGLAYVHIPKYQAQISIVSSAGMTVSPESLALTNNGTMFLQDGLYNDTNRMLWNDDGCEAGLEFEGGTEAVQREAFLSATDVIFEHRTLNEARRLDLYKNWEQNLNGSFSAKAYQPQINIFDAVDIAMVATP